MEVAKDLPPKTHVGSALDPRDPQSPVGIWLPMEGEQERAYREMETLSVARLDSGRLNAVSSLAELTRLKQMACSYGDIGTKKVRVSCEKAGCEGCHLGKHILDKYIYSPQAPSNKLNWIIEALEEWGFPREPLTKVVIVSFYTGILECFSQAIEAHFKTKPGAPLTTAISGRVASGDRRGIIDRFNAEGGPAVMMLNVKAGGVAITLDSADRMIFISETRVPDQQLQAEDRIHRVSNPRRCMYYYLRSTDTVDVGTALVNAEAMADSHRLLDGRRGVEYTRQVMALSHR